jgi:hypothetical protein
MPHTPPPIREAEFEAVDISDEDEVARRFQVHVRDLHAYLNQLPCLKDLQEVRRKWKSRTSESAAFGNFGRSAKHWYTFHHGGRNEAQFNLGLWPTYFRVGLGFEFTLKKFGEPAIVWFAYSCFLSSLREQLTPFRNFVLDNSLEIEWEDNDENVIIMSTDKVVDWLLDPPAARWIFVGRLLRRNKDKPVLETPETLDAVIQTVLCGFRPIWEQTQMMAFSTLERSQTALLMKRIVYLGLRLAFGRCPGLKILSPLSYLVLPSDTTPCLSTFQASKQAYVLLGIKGESRIFSASLDQTNVFLMLQSQLRNPKKVWRLSD